MMRTRMIALAALCAAIPLGARAAEAGRKPNVLVIMNDQQFADCMSCVMGNEYLSTPQMDALAENGMRFTRAYSPNPLCMPMRTAMITGHYPHQTGIQDNTDRTKLTTPDKFEFMPKLFSDAGYVTAYFGKWHIPYSAESEQMGLELNLASMKHAYDPAAAAKFIEQKHDRPFFVMVSFNGPHEVCEWARRQKLPGGVDLGPVPSVQQFPPLRDNMAPPQNESDIMAYIRRSYQAPPSLFPVGNYTDSDWGRLVWGYYRLIERVDGFIGTVMKALRDSGQEENTVVVFLSDHGDCHGAHGWNQKTVFYEESARVPFIISWAGRTPKGTSDLLVNTGIDLFPTLCDFAGIVAPSDLPGKSLKAPALGKTPVWRREYVVSENYMSQGQSVDGVLQKPHGRMVRSDRYKYCLYSEGRKREELYDMEKDPGEMLNQAANPEFKKTLTQHRAFLREHAESYDDSLAREMLKDME